MSRRQKLSVDAGVVLQNYVVSRFSEKFSANPPTAKPVNKGSFNPILFVVPVCGAILAILTIILIVIFIKYLRCASSKFQSLFAPITAFLYLSYILSTSELMWLLLVH